MCIRIRPETVQSSSISHHEFGCTCLPFRSDMTIHEPNTPFCKPVVSTMTLTGRYEAEDAFDAQIARSIEAIPTTLTPDEDLMLPLNRDSSVKKHTKRETLEQVATQVVWKGIPVTISVRLQPHVGTRGTGEATLSNFRNCVTFRARNRVAKIFRSGSVHGCGFKSVDEFHDFASTALSIIGPQAEMNEMATEVVLVISGARLTRSTPIHLRNFARQCATKTADGEYVECDLNAYPGVKVKMPHPENDKKQISVAIQSRGSVTLWYGNPGSRVDNALASAWERLAEIFGCDDA